VTWASPSRRAACQETGWHRLDGYGHDGQDALVAGRRGQRAAGPASHPTTDRARPTLCPPRPLLLCTDGLCIYIRAIRETFRGPVRRGTGGRPRLRSWHNVLIAQVVKRYKRRRVVDTERRMVDGTVARVETLRGARKAPASSTRPIWNGSTRRFGSAWPRSPLPGTGSPHPDAV
jgi:hypothetical protein